MRSMKVLMSLLVVYSQGLCLQPADDLRIGANPAGTVVSISVNGMFKIRRLSDAIPHKTFRARLYGVVWPNSSKTHSHVLKWLKQRSLGKTGRFVLRQKIGEVWMVMPTLDDLSEGCALGVYMVSKGMVDTYLQEFPFGMERKHAIDNKLGIWANPHRKNKS